MPDDIVLLRDSDLLIYARILTVWRPISKGQFLLYDVPGILAVLRINRTQLTVLCMVSKNHYNADIPSLGCVANLSIIRHLDDDGNVH
ncbi:hypothetical protein BC939DRAFT_458464 [Gamsiella multidivaricata]|uniref:uncharacterized protein n=1 Tax=Gamsiella multidivaricata TaxID=101098 RepID=UPI002220CD98|nr:uncharacterized protein BC939DRAFT_458464 [Gamsiella multidivaricata]KAI7820152.1 hypothetical protein BC939DRAFT_458464 [Gamsiella multidivaricata]